MTNTLDLEWTGERYLPWLDGMAAGAYEHWHRYIYAAHFVKNKKVLDIACGEGFGSSYLSQFAQSIVGIDLDSKSIEHARKAYGNKGQLNFLVGSMLQIPIVESNAFDVVVSFESIEHIENPDIFLREVKRVLKPKGVFIVSTPNKAIYTDKFHVQNPFHFREYYQDEFHDLIKKFFDQVVVLGQNVSPTSNIWALSKTIPNDHLVVFEDVVVKESSGFIPIESSRKTPFFFIAVATNDSNIVNTPSAYMIDDSRELFAEKDKILFNAIQEKDSEILQRDWKLADQDVRLKARIEELESIYGSKGWKMLMFFRKIRDTIPFLRKS